jgi:GH43 family beta-xylosidase
MKKGSSSESEQKSQQKVIAAQNQANQFGETDTEFSLEESVQEAVAKSQQYEANNQQPTYEPNKPV